MFLRVSPLDLSTALHHVISSTVLHHVITLYLKFIQIKKVSSLFAKITFFVFNGFDRFSICCILQEAANQIYENEKEQHLVSWQNNPNKDVCSERVKKFKRILDVFWQKFLHFEKLCSKSEALTNL